MQVGAKVESLELLVRQELISQAGCALAPYKAGGSELALATAAQVWAGTATLASRTHLSLLTADMKLLTSHVCYESTLRTNFY